MPALPRGVANGVRRTYTRALLRLLRALAAAAARTVAAGLFGPGRHEAERDLSATVRAVYEQLRVDGPTAVFAAVDRASRHGHRYAVNHLPAGVNPAMPTLVDDMWRRNLLQRLDGVHTAILTQVPAAHRAAVNAATLAPEGHTERAAQRELDRAADRGLLALSDRRGRNWGMVSAPVTATTTAANEAMLETITATYEDANVRFVQVTGIGSQHHVCIPWEGTILTLTGGGSRIIDGVWVKGSVADAHRAGVFHANCIHGLKPWKPGDPRDRSPYPRHVKGSVSVAQLVRHWQARHAAAFTSEARSKARRRLRELRDSL